MGRQTILQKITDYILTGGRRTTAVNTRDVLNEMANTYMSVIHDTAANFTSSNPVLETKQIGVVSDSLLSSPQYKIGDGINHWNDLPYSSGGGGIPNLQQVTDTGSETTNDIDFFGGTDGFYKVRLGTDGTGSGDGNGSVQVYDDANNSSIEIRGTNGIKVHDNAYTGNSLFEVIRDNGIDTDKVVINATTTELTQGTASKLLRLNASKEIVSSSYDEIDLLPETAATIGSIVNAATSATPNDTDLVMSVESSVAKKSTWTQIKAFLKTYFDTIYTTTSAVATQITTALTNYVTLTGTQTLTNKTLTSPIISDIVGGSSTTQTISYKTTTGVGATGADHVFTSGNNGATEILRLLNNGNVAQLGYTGTAFNGIYMNLSSPSNVTTKWIELVSNSRNTEKSALIFTTLDDNTSGSGKLVVNGIASGNLNGGSRIGIRIDGSDNTSIYLTQNNAGSNHFGIEGGASVTQISVNKDFIPTGNNALYLGYSNRRWLHAYFNNLYPTLIQSSSTIDVTGYNYQYASLLPATGAVGNQLIKTYFLSTDAGTSTSFVAGVFRLKNTVAPTAGAQKTHFAFDTNLNGTIAERMRIDGVGLAVFGLNAAFTPTALLHLGAEGSAANTEPIRFTTPANQTSTPVAGAFGVSTSGDNLNFVIATGAARKTIVLADTNLTSGRVAVITTNGRLTNSSAPAADGVYSSPTSITIANGIITAIS